ncbi:MAG: TetR/AcrR family transcriptional regulator [Spirochaetales bacterium]|nr:TetR/AcrR family transcriptional regulator [Spirochaetales bacterium]
MTDKHEQKKHDIINTAFVQWSRDLYANTSLTVVAEAMNMTKPALFRYFPSKESLCDAMVETFTSDLRVFADQFISEIEHGTLQESFAVLIDKGFDFFISHSDRHYFLFFTSPMIKPQIINKDIFSLYRCKTIQIICEQYSAAKGIPLSEETCEHILFFCFYTAVSVYMYRRKYVYKTDSAHFTEAMLDETKRIILDALFNGQRQNTGDKTVLTDEDFMRIENDIIGSETLIRRDKVFEAITSVIAQDGIVNASMDRIAKALGFNSKSSLYSHFTSRDNMLQQLFENESDLILNYVKANGLKYDNFNEDLYGCMAATFCYFTADANVLKYFDWLHYQMIRESVNPCPKTKLRMFGILTEEINRRHNISFDAENGASVTAVVLLSTYIVRLIVRKNEKNGGTTSSEEVRDLREIYKIYMEGI